ncbi:hypothetical protein HCY58_06020 [Acinetobacter radioresistens]|uniref:hypothetical protein n=1 Tax=Acinetobacter radioresistens TaxID=40216 RepID=UPI0020057261|nr:hypothetical protein [Acinetobacter radioresistens]MCK4086624.1 hypothetical protein [Acinetobacter radioresistens]
MSIGIFWFYDNKVIGIAHDFSLKEADSIGLIDSKYTHVDYWEILRRQLPELKDREYEQLPRGRVIFDTNKNKAIIYIDETLLKRRKVNEILNFFDLDFTSVVLRTDSHYKI